MNRRASRLIVALLAVLSSLPVHARKRAAPATPARPSPATKKTENDFPTQARVEYVLQCMQEHGGQNYDNLYHCVCAADKIAGQMSYQDYSEALTFTYLFDLPGEKGGEFRDPPRSKELRDALKAARREAETCFPPKPAAARNEPEATPAPAPAGSPQPKVEPASPAPTPETATDLRSGRGRPAAPRGQ